MATFNKTSVLTDSLLPEFLDDDGPKFQAFVRAYYEWMETTNQVTDRSKNLLNYQDIDETADEFLEYFKREIFSSFPKSILANKALVYKRIKDLHKAKGTEEAYRLLFRILFDEEIEFYYPGGDILRASDGRWVQENTVRISAPFTGNPENFAARNVVGQTSGATAKVNRVQSTLETGIPVYELFLDNISGTFQDYETVADIDGTISGVIIASVGPLQGVVVSFGGAGHQKGDGVTFTSTSGISANGVVSRTIDNSLDVAVANGGSGYAVGTPLTITGGGGSGASFSVSSIGNTEIIPIYDDTIAPFASVVLNTGPTFVSLGANTASVSANLASSNVSSVLSSALGTTNTVVGTITAVTFASRGSNYTGLPTITAKYTPVADLLISDGFGGIKGFNATFTPSKVSGSIDQVTINNPGSSYNKTDLVTITNISRSGTQNAKGAPLITGVINYPGAYVDTKGFLSWNNKLQDNYFYQEFSYVIRSSKAIDTYREIVKTAIHPSGTKLFGEARLEANISFTTTVEDYVNLSIEDIQSIASTTTIGIPNVTPTITPVSIDPTLTFGDFTYEVSVGPQSVVSTVVIPNPELDTNLGGGILITINTTQQAQSIVIQDTLTNMFFDNSTGLPLSPTSNTALSTTVYKSLSVVSANNELI